MKKVVAIPDGENSTLDRLISVLDTPPEEPKDSEKARPVKKVGEVVKATAKKERRVVLDLDDSDENADWIKSGQWLRDNPGKTFEDWQAYVNRNNDNPVQG